MTIQTKEHKMKLQRYRFERVVQEITKENIIWLKGEFKSILESNKSYESKCDYIGYSILSTDEKIQVLDEQIKELQSYKKKLKEAKAIVLDVGADVFESYGITKIEGGGISSITVTPSSSKINKSIEVHNEQALIDAGFYKKVLDIALVEKYHECGEYTDIIEANAEIKYEEVTSSSKLKVNKRRGATLTIAQLLEQMIDINKEVA
jgi:hypothetical protein